MTSPASDAPSHHPADDRAQPSTGQPIEMVRLATAMQKLGEAIIARNLPPEVATRLTEQLERYTDEVSAHGTLPKIELMGSNRISHFLETGEWPPGPPDGSPLEFDPASVVGGERNPFSMGARYRRDGDEAVGRVRVGRCFEGPPTRVHGGVLCAIFDEVMGSVFRATGTASAFTGELTVRFEAPAPLDTDLEFRARLVGSEGRRRMLEAEGTGPDGRFASASAVFIEMKPEHFVTRASPQVSTPNSRPADTPAAMSPMAEKCTPRSAT